MEVVVSFCKLLSWNGGQSDEWVFAARFGFRVARGHGCIERCIELFEAPEIMLTIDVCVRVV